MILFLQYNFKKRELVEAGNSRAVRSGGISAGLPSEGSSEISGRSLLQDKRAAGEISVLIQDTSSGDVGAVKFPSHVWPAFLSPVIVSGHQTTALKILQNNKETIGLVREISETICD